jgi:murein DD-endopeptidase MepM/ murein hydrolase activator NlpD
MRMSAVAFLMILTTFFLSGCDSTKVAAVDDRGNNFYGRNGTTRISSAVAAVKAAPIATFASSAAVSAAAPAASVTTRDVPPPAATASAAPVATLAQGTWQWPVQGKITETYGQKSDGIANEGIVIAAAEGTPIRAAQAGEVAFVGKDTKNYGNIVILRHADGDMTSYAHAREISVKKGDRIAAGGTLGYVGQSGNAKQPQLHFAVREGTSSIDPLTKLPHQVASN